MKYSFNMFGRGVRQIFCYAPSGNIYFTNDMGDGVFVADSNWGHERQLTGTCQFSVRGLNKASARAKIRKWILDRNYEEV